MNTATTCLTVAIASACLLGAASIAPPRVDADSTADLPATLRQCMLEAEARRADLGATAATSGCEPQMWFDPNPRTFVAGCDEVAAMPVTPADVNGDGAVENLQAITANSRGEFVVVDAPWTNGGFLPAISQPAEVMRAQQLLLSSDGPSPSSRIVCSLDTGFGDWFRSRLPDSGGIYDPQGGWGWSWTVRGIVKGWLDCDGDGDLDLVIRMTTYRVPCVGSEGSCYPMFNQNGQILIEHETMDIWLENVGFQKLVGDLDRNGRVDSGDIAILLLNFSQ